MNTTGTSPEQWETLLLPEKQSPKAACPHVVDKKTRDAVVISGEALQSRKKERAFNRSG